MASGTSCTFKMVATCGAPAFRIETLKENYYVYYFAFEDSEIIGTTHFNAFDKNIFLSCSNMTHL